METITDFRMPPNAKHRETYAEDEEEDPTFIHTRETERPRYTRRRPASPSALPPPSVNAPVGAWTVAEILLRFWYWIVLAAFLGMLGGYFGGTYLFKSGYVASAELIRRTFGHDQNAAYKPRDFTEDGFKKLLKSKEVLERVSPLTKPRLSADQLNSVITVTMTGDSEVFTIDALAPIPENAWRLANLYATNAVKYTQQLQAQEAGEFLRAVTNQLAAIEQDRQKLAGQLRDLQTPRGPAPPSQRIMDLREQLNKAEQKLISALSTLTTNHPTVKALIAERDQWRAELAAAEKGTAPERQAPVGPDPEIVRNQLLNLDSTRNSLQAKQQEAQIYVDEPPGCAEIFEPAELADVHENNWKMKVMLTTVLGGLGGFFAGLFLVLLVEVFDERIKTVEDVKRVTKLPLLATLGSTRKMDAEAQANWAFRTWTALQCQLKVSPNHGVVCGITSAGHGEGRSTWINLLSQAAGQCGFRVLTIGTVHMPEGFEFKDWFADAEEAEAKAETEKPADAKPSSNGAPSAHQTEPAESNGTVMKSMLSSPLQVTQKLTSADSQTFVHIPLPGWVWNLERRKQWQGALGQWKRIENVVIFVELPPASMAETVLLAQKLPNVIWLARAGKSRSWATRNYLQTLHYARCNLVGCVLNGSTKGSFRRRFSRWINVWTCLAGIALGANAAAQEGTTAAEDAQGAAKPPEGISITNFSFSASDKSQRAEWQKRLTLGPGDVLNISLFGQPEMDRKEVAIGPDGRLNYLQATDIPVTGLTVDELREKLDQELAKFYRTPRTVVVPVTLKSKKYYVLGKVANRGVYSLERPLTIVEAVARAKGLETGLIDNNNLADIADLQRSFLMRNGQRLKVNFERLFQEGDFSQNIAIEPDDYLYFAAMAMKEVYVLGEVRQPGPTPHTANSTVAHAIANRGGFTDRAFKSRVVVIRGSLNSPRTYIVNTWETLEGRALDFKLEPRDIVYVHYRPFIKVEELLDLAVAAFVQSVATSWTGKHIGPIITSPIF
jgi:protein involved in polysaccharide export with SLBB domain/capsular polysaccharide biosynthesis protein